MATSLSFSFYLPDIGKNDKDTPNPISNHFNPPYHSKHYISGCDLFLHLGNLESCKTLGQKFYHSNRHSFHPTNLFMFSGHHIPTDSVPPFSAYMYRHTQYTIPPLAFKLLTVANLRYQLS